MSESSLADGLELAGMFAGLLSSLLLLVTALKAAPLNEILQKAAKIDPDGPAAKIKVALEVDVNKSLTSLRLIERPLLIWGASLLLLSFVFNLISTLLS